MRGRTERLVEAAEHLAYLAQRPPPREAITAPVIVVDCDITGEAARRLDAAPLPHRVSSKPSTGPVAALDGEEENRV